MTGKDVVLGIRSFIVGLSTLEQIAVGVAVGAVLVTFLGVWKVALLGILVAAASKLIKAGQ